MVFLKSLFDPLHGRYQRTAFSERSDLLPPFAWRDAPLALLIATFVFLQIDRDLFIWWVRTETGPGENITAGLFVISGILAFIIARRRDAIPVRWLRVALVVIGVLALLIAGEEWSWGQHFFGWRTPEWLAEVNSQQETNLHNVFHRTLDQKPRAIFSIVVLIVAVIAPLLRQRLTWLDRYPVLDWLMPGRFLIPTALIIVLPRVIDRFQVWFDIHLPGALFIPTRDFQEIQELFIAIFVFLYLVNLLLRIRRFEAGQSPAA
jgi:hypothetical protein